MLEHRVSTASGSSRKTWGYAYVEYTDDVRMKQKEMRLECISFPYDYLHGNIGWTLTPVRTVYRSKLAASRELCASAI